MCLCRRERCVVFLRCGCWEGKQGKKEWGAIFLCRRRAKFSVCGRNFSSACRSQCVSLFKTPKLKAKPPFAVSSSLLATLVFIHLATHSLTYTHSLASQLCIARTTSINYRTKQANTQPGQTIQVNTGPFHRGNSPSTTTSIAASLLPFLGKAELFFIVASLDLRLLSDERTSIRLLNSTHSHNVWSAEIPCRP